MNEMQYLCSVDFLSNGLDTGKQTITVWKLERRVLLGGQYRDLEDSLLRFPIEMWG